MKRMLFWIACTVIVPIFTMEEPIELTPLNGQNNDEELFGFVASLKKWGINDDHSLESVIVGQPLPNDMPINQELITQARSFCLYQDCFISCKDKGSLFLILDYLQADEETLKKLAVKYCNSPYFYQIKGITRERMTYYVQKASSKIKECSYRNVIHLVLRDKKINIFDLDPARFYYLKTIDLSGNAFTESPLKRLFLCKRIAKINLANNQIARLADDEFASAPSSLKIVDLRNNLLQKFPMNSAKWLEGVSFKLEGNPLFQMTDRDWEIGVVPKLYSYAKKFLVYSSALGIGFASGMAAMAGLSHNVTTSNPSPITPPKPYTLYFNMPLFLVRFYHNNRSLCEMPLTKNVIKAIKQLINCPLPYKESTVSAIVQFTNVFNYFLHDRKELENDCIRMLDGQWNEQIREFYKYESHGFAYDQTYWHIIDKKNSPYQLQEATFSESVDPWYNKAFSKEEQGLLLLYNFTSTIPPRIIKYKSHPDRAYSNIAFALLSSGLGGSIVVALLQMYCKIDPHLLTRYQQIIIERDILGENV